MKEKYLFTGLLLILFVFLTQSKSQDLSVSNKSESKVVLEVKTDKLSKTEWQFKVKIQNNNDKIIYLTTEPTQVNSEKGQYLSLDKKDNSILKIETRVFPPPFVDYYSNDTRVKLIKLSPNEIYTENINLKFPLRETSPPNGTLSEEFWTKAKNKTLTDEEAEKSVEGYSPFGKKINQKEIKLIIISYGYFIEDDGITDFLKRKPFGWFIKGNERIFTGDSKGKDFIEIQNITTSNTLKIFLDSKK